MPRHVPKPRLLRLPQLNWRIDLPDGSKLVYDQGSFDSFCVYHVPLRGPRKPPRDVVYFGHLVGLGARHGNDHIYREFCRIYSVTTAEFNPAIAADILARAKLYGQDEAVFAFCFGCIYLAMIAEANKAGTRLGKRIKRLGVHQMLCEGLPVDVAANFSRGQRWDVLDQLCRSKGF